MGRTLWEALEAPLAQVYEPYLRRTLQGETFEQEHGAHGRYYVSRCVPIRDPQAQVIHVLVVSFDITERRRAEEKLRQNELQLRSLIETIGDIFWIEDWGKRKLVYVSPSFKEVWGPEVSEVLDRYETWIEAIHPELDFIHFETG